MCGMSDDKWLTADEQSAWRALQTMQARLGAELNARLLSDSELSLSDYAVLVHLTDEPSGRLRLFELANEIGWERSRLSHHIARMAKRDLVEKVACDKDRRGAYVAITEEGRQAISLAAPRHVATVRQLVIDQLTPAELSVIRSVSNRVLATIDQHAE